MRTILIDSGEPVLVRGGPEPIGEGPWARLVATAIVPAEHDRDAERARGLARTGAVRRVEVGAGIVTARVAESTGIVHEVTLRTDPVPPGAWREAARSARGNPTLEAAAEGREQSVHLAHLLLVAHGEPLVPAWSSIRRDCSCADARRRESGRASCTHVGAAGYVLADAVDRDPSLLLLWRGCAPLRPSGSAAAWALAAELPSPPPLRPLPPGAVLKRLRRSGIRAGDADLVDALAPAYAAFAASAHPTDG